MDEVAKQFDAIMARDSAGKAAPTGVPGFAPGGAGGGVQTTGKITADSSRPLQPATTASSLTARDRITTSVSELEHLIADIETMIADLLAIRDRL
jgi:hypothetical protein